MTYTGSSLSLFLLSLVQVAPFAPRYRCPEVEFLKPEDMSSSFERENTTSSLIFGKMVSKLSKRFELVTGGMHALTAIGVFLISVTFTAIKKLSHSGDKHGETQGEEGHR